MGKLKDAAQKLMVQNQSKTKPLQEQNDSETLQENSNENTEDIVDELNENTQKALDILSAPPKNAPTVSNEELNALSVKKIEQDETNAQDTKEVDHDEMNVPGTSDKTQIGAKPQEITSGAKPVKTADYEYLKRINNGVKALNESIKIALNDMNNNIKSLYTEISKNGITPELTKQLNELNQGVKGINVNDLKTYINSELKKYTDSLDQKLNTGVIEAMKANHQVLTDLIDKTNTKNYTALETKLDAIKALVDNKVAPMLKDYAITFNKLYENKDYLDTLLQTHDKISKIREENIDVTSQIGVELDMTVISYFESILTGLDKSNLSREYKLKRETTIQVLVDYLNSIVTAIGNQAPSAQLSLIKITQGHVKKSDILEAYDGCTMAGVLFEERQ